MKADYKKRRESYLKKTKLRNQAIEKENQIQLLKYFEAHPCIDCGEKDPVVLEFDHLEQKDFSISILRRRRNWISVLKEINKCVVRCANCHKRKTAKQFGWWKTNKN